MAHDRVTPHFMEPYTVKMEAPPIWVAKSRLPFFYINRLAGRTHNGSERETPLGIGAGIRNSKQKPAE